MMTARAIRRARPMGLAATVMLLPCRMAGAQSGAVPVNDFDGIFEGDDVHALVGVDVVDHAGERCGLATAGRAGNEDQAALLGEEGLEGVLWEAELFEGGDGFVFDDAHGQADGAALPGGVGAEPADRPQAKGEVGVAAVQEVFPLAWALHGLLGVCFEIFRGERRLPEAVDDAVDAGHGGASGAEVNIARATLDKPNKELFEDNHAASVSTWLCQNNSPEGFR